MSTPSLLPVNSTDIQSVSANLHFVASNIDTVMTDLAKLQSAATVAETLPILVTINNASYSVNDSTTQSIIQQGITNQQAPLNGAYQALINALITYLQFVAATF